MSTHENGDVAAPPIACTLDASAMPQRLSDWQAMLDRVSARQRTEDGALRLAFPRDIDLEELVRLVSVEQQCCAFFGFSLHVDHASVALEVRAPDGAEELVTALFGGQPDSTS